MHISPYVYPGMIKHEYIPEAYYIIEKVCYYYNITFEDLVNESRKKEYVRPRHVICYLLYKYKQFSYGKIAKEINRKCHTTIMNAVSKITFDKHTNKTLQRDLIRLRLVLSL